MLFGFLDFISGIPARAWSAMIAFGALLLSYTIVRFSIRNKQIDFLLYDHKQFDELQKKRAELLVAKSKLVKDAPMSDPSRQALHIDAQVFFDRFWSLQFEGFVGWHEGYIPTDIFKYWLFVRWQEIVTPSENWSFEAENMRTSLERIDKEWPMHLDRKSFQLRIFCKFLDLMNDLGDKKRVDVDVLLKKYGPNRIQRAWRRLFGAY